ncbi:carbohydrate kinase family protein [Chelativorans sp.]|uniref:carbohydrate kinase family protein n=1 Tax=Chelativorans sp. TaxID=2203393 RepID=UPI00281131F8|nr:carbohydrate kinase family protein [Chelativorans sp.]
MRRARLFAVGGAHMDRRGRVRGPHVPEASNPGTMREEVGGGAFNAARTAVRRGISVSLMSLRGGDAAGERVAEAIEEAGIEDFSAIFLDRATPSYTAILTEGGDLITGLADMGLYEIGFARQLRRRKIRDGLAEADAVLCDANVPAEAIELLAEVSRGKPFFALAISPAKALRLAPVLGSLSCLFMNRREACALAGLPMDSRPRQAAQRLADMGLRAGIISAGGDPALCLDNGRLFEVAPPESRIADVTGAGDALAGASIAALMRGYGLAEAAREGMAAAKLALESENAAPDFDEDGFGAALALVPPGRALD